MQDTPTPRSAMVLFADLLGFSHQVEEAPTPDDALKLAAKLKRFANNFSEDGTSLDFYAKKYWAFSDSIVVAWYKGSDAEKVMTEFDANLSELSGIAFAQAMSMREDNQLVRGGIGGGWLLEDEETVVGDALVKAARLEKLVANPFIAVDQELYGYYLSHHGRNFYHSSIDPVPDLFISPSAYTNNLPALDYLAIGLGEIDLTPLQLSEARLFPPSDERDAFMNKCYNANRLEFAQWHREFVSEGLASNDARIARKYAALRDHHNRRMSIDFADDALLLPIL